MCIIFGYLFFLPTFNFCRLEILREIQLRPQYLRLLNNKSFKNERCEKENQTHTNSHHQTICVDRTLFPSSSQFGKAFRNSELNINYPNNIYTQLQYVYYIVYEWKNNEFHRHGGDGRPMFYVCQIIKKNSITKVDVCYIYSMLEAIFVKNKVQMVPFFVRSLHLSLAPVFSILFKKKCDKTHSIHVNKAHTEHSRVDT